MERSEGGRSCQTRPVECCTERTGDVMADDMKLASRGFQGCVWVERSEFTERYSLELRVR